MTKEEDVRKIPEFEAAIERNNASFTQFVEVHFYQKEKFNPNLESRRAHANYQQQIYKAFENAHGGIERLFEAENVVASVVLTNIGHLEHVGPIKIAPLAVEQLLRLSALNSTAKQCLHGKELKTYALELYATATFLYKVIDECSTDEKMADSDNIKKRISFASSLLDTVERKIESAAQRNSQIDYCGGMLAGCVALSIIFCIFFNFLSRFKNDVCGAISGGTLGAFISVLTRITDGQLKLHYEAGRRMVFLLGGFRPIIGVAAAIFTWSIIESSLIPITVNTEQTSLFFFSTGFIAGFSERWAQDMLTISTAAILTSKVKEEQGNEQN